ncbi:unnamed protein product [Paramecium octaurelia]|uniref:diphthine methyl ester synthase n=1 Tax=Paramecium octaurelia TaxID=43137 RepID=A0A8S1XC37_PAROT|nr:unnamed protein product [Paramecium octaurelia]
MVFFIIGLGLGDHRDITVKGFEAVKTCKEIYLESYTSILGINRLLLQEFYGKEVIEADRECCETGIDQILENVSKDPQNNYAFLVVGDPFCATTHTDLFLRAVKLGIKVEVVHNASIINAIGCTGLQVYRFGETVSVPFFTEKWKPYSFYPKIKANLDHNLHTLVLLDIKVKEISEENLARGKKIYEAPRFMSTQVAVEQIIESDKQLGLNAIDEKTKCFGVARVGFETQKIVSGFLHEFLDIEMGPPLHSFVICAKELHPIEEEMFQFYRNNQQKID